MAKTCAISWQMAKVPHGTQLCILGCLYRLFAVCLQGGQTAKKRAQRRGGGGGRRQRVEGGGGGGRRRRLWGWQKSKTKGEAEDKDGGRGRRQRWRGSQTAKPPLTPNGGNACRLPSRALCQLLLRKADGKELCHPLCGDRRQRRYMPS